MVVNRNIMFDSPRKVDDLSGSLSFWLVKDISILSSELPYLPEKRFDNSLSTNFFYLLYIIHEPWKKHYFSFIIFFFLFTFMYAILSP